MSLNEHFIALTIYLIIMMTLNRENVETKSSLIQLSDPFSHVTTIEEAFALHFKKFQEKVESDQKRKHDEEMDVKRSKIFRNYLLVRVTGSILNDFFSRL